MRQINMKFAFVVALAFVAFSASTYAEEFSIDRSVMSEAYWKIWNDALDQLINHEWRTNVRVKVKGDGEQRKVVSFRGFRGRYRLSWVGADGKPMSKLVEVK